MTSASAKAEEPWRAEALLTSVSLMAALGTAWAAFETENWGSVQAVALEHAAQFRLTASEARLQADQSRHFDVDLFIAYLQARVEHHDDWADFLHSRFPRRLETATDAWLTTQPFTKPSAPLHPFAMPEYRVDSADVAAKAQEQADRSMAEGLNANRNADFYVLGAMLLSTTIVMTGLGAGLKSRGAQRLVLVLSGLALLATLAWLATRPVAWPGAMQSGLGPSGRISLVPA